MSMIDKTTDSNTNTVKWKSLRKLFARFGVLKDKMADVFDICIEKLCLSKCWKCCPCISGDDRFVDLEKTPRIDDNGASSEAASSTKKVSVCSFRKEEPVCVRCTTNSANVVILPCGHGTYCNDCLEIWCESSTKCPVCAVDMTDVVQCI